MRVQSVCLRCGYDATRVRAAPDPHYGLRVVVCPGCGWAWVRRWPQAERTTRKRLAAGMALAAQLSATIVLPLVLFTNAAPASEVLRGSADAVGVSALAMTALVAIVTGLWLGATVQVPALVAWLSWCAWVTALLAAGRWRDALDGSATTVAPLQDGTIAAAQVLVLLSLPLGRRLAHDLRTVEGADSLIGRAWRGRRTRTIRVIRRSARRRRS